MSVPKKTPPPPPTGPGGPGKPTGNPSRPGFREPPNQNSKAQKKKKR